MTKYYAIADIHGRYDLLLEAVDKIYSHAGSDPYKIITLGDYIDRGPDSKKVIDFLSYYRGDTISLQGNHEAMMVESITAPLSPDWWIGNGGDATLRSYGWGGEPYSQLSYEVVPKDHIDWMRDLPLCYETEKQVFVHAGIPQYDMNLPPKDTPKGERLQQQMLWMLYDNRTAGGWKGKHVVHGHHQFADGPHVYHGKHGGRTALDTWADHTGRLVVGVYDDSRGSAIDYIEVKV